MSATVLSAIVSTVTTGILTFIAVQIRRGVKAMRQFRTEHHYLMTQSAANTRFIERIMKHLDMSD